MDDRPQPPHEEETDQLRSLMEAMANPIQGMLIAAIAEDTATSARELAEIIGEPVRRVRYHLDALAKGGLVAVSSEATRRGAVERYYRAVRLPMLSTEDFNSLDEGKARELLIQILRYFLFDIRLTVAAGTYGSRPGSALIRLRRDVDTQGWNELSALQDRGLEEAQAICDAAEERLGKSGEEATPATVAFLLFESAMRAKK